MYLSWATKLIVALRSELEQRYLLLSKETIKDNELVCYP